MYSFSDIQKSYLYGKHLIDQSRTIANLFATRRFLKLFETHAAQTHPHLIRQLDELFQLKKRIVVARYENRNAEKKTVNKVKIEFKKVSKLNIPFSINQ